MEETDASELDASTISNRFDVKNNHGLVDYNETSSAHHAGQYAEPLDPPPARGASHTRTMELRKYIVDVLSTPSMTANEDATTRRFSAILLRTQANSLSARRFRSLLNELYGNQSGTMDHVKNAKKRKILNVLSPQEAIYYKSTGGLVRGTDCRQAAVAINDYSISAQQTESTASTLFSRRQLCAMIMRMSQNDLNHAAVEIAQLSPPAFLAELRDEQIQLAAPLIVQGLSRNIRPQDHDLRARALLHLWPKDSVYRGLWNWYHIDAKQSNDRL